jgi:hypothetical protein
MRSKIHWRSPPKWGPLCQGSGWVTFYSQCKTHVAVWTGQTTFETSFLSQVLCVWFDNYSCFIVFNHPQTLFRQTFFVLFLLQNKNFSSMINELIPSQPNCLLIFSIKSTFNVLICAVGLHISLALVILCAFNVHLVLQRIDYYSESVKPWSHTTLFFFCIFKKKKNLLMEYEANDDHKEWQKREISTHDALASWLAPSSNLCKLFINNKYSLNFP